MRLPDNDQWQYRFYVKSETSNRLYVIAQHKRKKHWGCYSDDTRVLTDHGFKLFADLTGTERFLSMDLATHELEWVEADAHIRYHCQGQMVLFKARNFDLLVTPDHRMAYTNTCFRHNHKDSSIQFKQATEITNADSVPRSGKWTGSSPIKIEVAGHSYDAALFMGFFGWYLSEGWIDHRPTKWSISIGQEHQSRLSEIRQLCRNLFGGHLSEAKNVVNIYRQRDLAQWLHQLWQSHEKYIPRELKELSPALLEIFLRAFCKGDGSEYDIQRWNENKTYKGNFQPFHVHNTSSLRLADDLAEIILKCGRTPSFYRSHLKRAGQPKTFSNGTYTIKHPCLAVAECHHTWRLMRSISSLVDYDREVFCVSLKKHHLLYVERNGRCTWSGNCSCPSYRARRRCKHLEAIGLPCSEIPFEVLLNEGEG